MMETVALRVKSIKNEDILMVMMIIIKMIIRRIRIINNDYTVKYAQSIK